LTIPDAPGDKVYTALDMALRQIGEKLKASKQTMALCEEQGFNDVIKIAKTLDCAKLAEWPTEKLAMVAAEKKGFVEYGFEIKASGNR